MPTLQVISREQDPGQKQMLEASKDIADTIHKTQALKLTAQYYKTLQQNADTETAKAELERKTALFDKYLPKIQETKDPATKQMYIRALTDPGGLYANDPHTLFHDIADGHQEVTKNYQAIPDVQAQMAQMQQDPGTANPQQLAGAQAEQYKQEAALNQVRAQNISHPEIAMQRMADGMKAFQNSQGDGGGGIDNPVITGGSINPATGDNSYQWSVPSADQAKSMATTQGTELGKQKVEMYKTESMLDDYLKQLDLANKEVGGPAKTQAEAQLKAMGANWMAGFRKDSVLPSTNEKATQVADQISTQINQGRSADYKIKITKDVIPSYHDSAATQQYLRQGLNAMLKIGVVGNPTNVAQDKPAQSAAMLKEGAVKARRLEQHLRSQGVSEDEISKRVNKALKQAGYL